MLARLENQVAAENEDAQSEGKATNRKVPLNVVLK